MSLCSALLFADESVASPETARPHRVVVAGRYEDPLASRVQKELTALGFETIRAGMLDNCAGPSVRASVKEANAVAAACSNGDEVDVWAMDRTSLRLQDVLMAGEQGRELTAVR